MKKDKLPLNTIIYTTMIKGYAKAQNLERALDIYEQMKMESKSDGNIKPNNVTFNSLLDCCVRCNNLEKAQEIFNEMKKMA
mmetsp:Transcript_29299/g.28465  ORF Transcript_29299/g.28465 Transcript_29299/m.28465 type:complete len:81 (+) Transcript_29299:2207-2449(+)